MGFEYRLAFAYQNRDDVVVDLTRLPGATHTSSDSPFIEFRADAKRTGMPDAMVSVEDYGLYFCDNGGHGRNYFGRVISLLVSRFGEVRVSELE